MQSEMKMEHILLTEENREEFESVFPAVFKEAENRISIGACEEDGTVVGALSFVLADYQYDVDWLYVVPERRRRGIATGLMKEFHTFITETGEWYPVSVRFPVTQEEASLHRFFLSLEEADVSYSHRRFFVTAQDIKKSVTIHQKAAASAKIGHFFEADENWQKRVMQQLEKSHGFTVSNEEGFREDCIPELCLYLKEGDDLRCGIFVQRSGEHELELVWCYGKNPTLLFQVLGEAAEAAEELFPEDSLTFEAINEKSEKLARHLFPIAKSIPVYEASW